jgi:hypothetical protein
MLGWLTALEQRVQQHFFNLEVLTSVCANLFRQSNQLELRFQFRSAHFFFFLLSMNMSKLSSTDNWFRKLHHEELHGSRVAKEDTNLPATHSM